MVDQMVSMRLFDVIHFERIQKLPKVKKKFLILEWSKLNIVSIVELSINLDARKKDRRKIRASSLESSTESENSAMETGDGNSGQVAAVSSTASFKSPAVGIGEEETNGEKQVKSLNDVSKNKK